MADSVTVTANKEGEYWIEVVIAVIANGALLSVHDDYDSALERSASLKHRFAHRMVFKAGETPFFGKEKIYPPRVLFGKDLI